MPRRPGSRQGLQQLERMQGFVHGDGPNQKGLWIDGDTLFFDGRIASRSGPVADVTAFGAVGNGVDDDQPAFQAALTYLAAAGGGVLWIPVGIYWLASTITFDVSNVIVRGAGYGSVLSPALGVYAFSSGVGQAVGFSISFFGFEDFRVYRGAGLWNQRNEAGEFSIKRVVCTGQTVAALNTSAVERFTFEELYVQNCGGYGWLANQYDNPLSTQAPRTQRFRLHRCTFQQVTEKAVYLQNLAGISNPDGLGASIDACAFLFNLKEALVVENVNGLSISGLSVEQAGAAANNTYDAVVIAPVGTAPTIQSVKISGSNFGTNGLANQQRYGLNINGSAACVVEACTGQGATAGFTVAGEVVVVNCNGSGTPGATGAALSAAGSNGALRFKEITSLVVTPGSNTVLAAWAAGDVAGIVFVVNRTAEQVAAFYLRGAAHQTQELGFDVNGVFSVTAGTGSSTNVYWSAGNSRYELENLSALGTCSYSLFFLATS